MVSTENIRQITNYIKPPKKMDVSENGWTKSQKMGIVRGIIMRQTDLEIPYLQTNQTNYNGESLNKSSLWYLYFVMHS